MRPLTPQALSTALALFLWGCCGLAALPAETAPSPAELARKAAAATEGLTFRARGRLVEVTAAAKLTFEPALLGLAVEATVTLTTAGVTVKFTVCEAAAA